MKGAYILLIYLGANLRIKIGSLGFLMFRKGYYCYIGSARGPGGIEARIGRHMRREKKIRWHIDYLLKHAEIKEAYYSTEMDEISIVMSFAENFHGIEGFGSSDSHMKSHLFFIGKNIEYFRKFMRNLPLEPFH